MGQRQLEGYPCECAAPTSFTFVLLVSLALSLSSRVPSLSYDEARQALLRRVNKQWFVNKAPAIEFEFVRMQPSSAYRVSCLVALSCDVRSEHVM